MWNVYRCKDDRYIAVSMSLVARWWARSAPLWNGRICSKIRGLRPLTTSTTTVPRSSTFWTILFAQREQWESVNDLRGKGAFRLRPSGALRPDHR